MAIDAASAADTANSSSQLNLQDFMKILTNQLNNQDPLKPLDNNEFMAQLAQFTSLEQTRQLNDKLASLLAVQSATQSTGLIGRTVEAKLETGSITGTVNLLDLSSGEPKLTVKDASGNLFSNVLLSQIVTVR
jgi:flagellar basal-body rod modification protein FlgD